MTPQRSKPNCLRADHYNTGTQMYWWVDGKVYLDHSSSIQFLLGKRSFAYESAIQYMDFLKRKAVYDADNNQ